ncbi:MAG: preprotein translocase subunit SecE [Candidatus Aerophobetes bacterium]|nr:preprotein translocase subunit SecE [Candidatus Aerophobetes bacterium]
MANKVSGFLRAVKSEMKKVSWPTRPQIVKSTIIVLVSLVVFAIIIGGMDIIFFQVIKIFLR